MRIGIISDTHIPGSTPELWPEVGVAFERADMILHAGDLESTRVLDWLERIAPVYAAEGNHDRGLSQYDPRIKSRQFLEVEGYRLGMTHIIDGWEQLGTERAVKYFLGEVPDIAVCGDSHYEFVRRENGLLVINGGSATYPHNLEARLGHVVLLDVERGGQPDAWIVDLGKLARGVSVEEQRRSPQQRLDAFFPDRRSGK
jgi:putative phosphoesterase